MTQLRNRDTGQVRTANEVEREIRQHTSAPAVIDFSQFGYDVVFPSPAPAYNQINQYVREIAPTQTSGKWYQAYEVLSLSQDEVNANIAKQTAALISSVMTSTQQRLDDFAKTRNYDGILSACTYATSSVPKFQGEGQYAVNARDDTWATLYTIMAEVEAQTRPMPSGYSDIEPLLPVLSWPL